jgi:hypothetical protein
MEGKKRQRGKRPEPNQRRRINFDIPIDTAALLEQIADEIGISVSELMRIQLGNLLETYHARSESNWLTDDSNPSRKVIEDVASLHSDNPEGLLLWSARRLRREIIILDEAQKIIARQRKKLSVNEN